MKVYTAWMMESGVMTLPPLPSYLSYDHQVSKKGRVGKMPTQCDSPYCDQYTEKDHRERWNPSHPGLLDDGIKSNTPVPSLPLYPVGGNLGHFRPNLRLGSKLKGIFHGFTLCVPLSTVYLIPEVQYLLWAVPGAMSRERYALASKWPKF